MITKQEVKELKLAKIPWDCIAQVLCTKLPDVVKRTAELARVGRDEKGEHMKGR